MRMATVDDYLWLDVAADVLSLGSAPGRALVHDREVQIAVLGGSTDATVQPRATTASPRVCVAPACQGRRRSCRFPSRCRSRTCPRVDETGRPAIGLSSTTMAPVGFDLRGSQIVLGPSGSGRTTAVLAMAQAALRARPGLRTWLFSPRRSMLTRAEGVWTENAVGIDDCRALASAQGRMVEATRRRHHARW